MKNGSTTLAAIIAVACMIASAAGAAVVSSATVEDPGEPGDYLLAPISVPLLGDVNGDGGATIGDAMLIAKYSVGLEVPYPIGGPLIRPGEVCPVPQILTIPVGTSYSDEIHVNTGAQRLGAFQLTITYDPDIIMPTAGAVTGPDGWTIVVNFDNDWAGQFIVAGFTATNPLHGNDVKLLTLNWMCMGLGTTALDLTIGELTDYDTGGPIYTPKRIYGIRIQE